MVSFSGGQIGFDEGGVLQALSKPLYSTQVTDYKRNKKGAVTKETVTNYTISMADVIVAAALVLGPIVFLKLRAGLPNIVPSGAVSESIEQVVSNLSDGIPSADALGAIMNILDPLKLIH